MIKKLVHLIVALTFPFYVLLDLLIRVMFFDRGLGESWIPQVDEMYKLLHTRD